MVLAVKFQEGNRTNPQTRVFEKKDPGFVIGKSQNEVWRMDGYESSLERIVDAFRKFGLPIYFIHGWARDSYVKLGTTYFARDISYLEQDGISICEGGFCVDNGRTALILTPEAHINFDRAQQDLARLKAQFLGDFEVVLLPHARVLGRHLDLYASFFGSRLIVDPFLPLNPEIFLAGVSATYLRSSNFELNIPIFNIEGQQFAFITERTQPRIRELLEKEGIKLIVVNLEGVFDPLHTDGAGIRCATNWIDNPDIFDFFGITYERIF